MTRGRKAGEKMASALIEFLHLMYNEETSARVLRGLIDRLQKRLNALEKKDLE